MSPVQFHSRPTVDVRHVMDQPKLTLQERTDRQTDRQTDTHTHTAGRRRKVQNTSITATNHKITQ